MEQFDHVIVGAGSAGCVLADRLSADGRASVLVLEAGGTDRNLWIRLPIGYGKCFHDPRVNWRFFAEPSTELGGRRSYFPRGKVVGGSSAINGLVYCRGLPRDFDDWEAAGTPAGAQPRRPRPLGRSSFDSTARASRAAAAPRPSRTASATATR